MVTYEGYIIKADKLIPSMYIVVTEGKGGKVPDMLTGMYTTPTFAKKDIDRYLKVKPMRGNKDGKASNESRTESAE